MQIIWSRSWAIIIQGRPASAGPGRNICTIYANVTPLCGKARVYCGVIATNVAGSLSILMILKDDISKKD